MDLIWALVVKNVYLCVARLLSGVVEVAVSIVTTNRNNKHRERQIERKSDGALWMLAFY